MNKTLSKQFLMSLCAMAGAAVFISSSPSFANDGATQGCGPGHHGGHKDHGDWEDHAQQRLDKLKTDLKIQPSQEGAWQAYAAKVKEKGEKMKALHQQAPQDTKLTLPEKLDRQINFMKEHQASAEETAVVLKALYASLTPEQRIVLDKHFARHRPQHG